VRAAHARDPAESYSSLETTDDRLRAIGMLQHRAQSLEAEIRRREEAEAALHQSEQNYRNLMELLPAAVYFAEAPSGILRYYNRRAGELWGRQPDLAQTGRAAAR
jgi:PAS domain-containing protein